MKTTVDRVIEMCGGEHAIAAEFRMANIYLVRKWKENGIPLVKWPAIIRLAKLRGHKLTGAMLWDAVEHLITE